MNMLVIVKNKPPIVIEVCERMMDHWTDENGEERPKYHAQIKGQPGIWGAGRSVQSAIGSLVSCHPEAFGLRIKHLEGKLPR